MNLVSPHDHSQLTAEKRSHDAERVGRMREDLHKHLNELLTNYTRDLQADPLGATKGNEPAVFSKYDALWRQRCLIVQKSSEPVDVDPEAFSDHVQLRKQNEAREKVARTAFHLLTHKQREEWDLVELYEVDLHLRIWITDRFAIILDVPSQVVGLHLYSDDNLIQGTEALGELARLGALPIIWRKYGLSLADVGGVLRAIGVKTWNKPSSVQLASALRSTLRRARWYNPLSWF